MRLLLRLLGLGDLNGRNNGRKNYLICGAEGCVVRARVISPSASVSLCKGLWIRHDLIHSGEAREFHAECVGFRV